MIDPELFKSAVVRQAYEYWLGKCSGDRLPRRADVKPAEMRGMLPYVFLVDVTHAPLVFRYRLVGSRITDWAEREYTGRAVDERDYGPHWQRVFDMYASVVATRGPRRDIYTAPWVSREFYHYERVVAPLSNDGTIIDMLFGALHTLPPEQV
ncbi:MAG TPA: PAS domain-containing protein [Alphaproteobacteria bacterium]